MDYKEFYINTFIIIVLTIMTIIIGGIDLISVSAIGWVYYILIHGVLFIPGASKSLQNQTKSFKKAN